MSTHEQCILLKRYSTFHHIMPPTNQHVDMNNGVLFTNPLHDRILPDSVTISDDIGQYSHSGGGMGYGDTHDYDGNTMTNTRSRLIYERTLFPRSRVLGYILWS